MSWIKKLFGIKPKKETSRVTPRIKTPPPPQIGREIWLVFWVSFYEHEEGISNAIISRRMRAFQTKMDAELFKEQIDICHELIGNKITQNNKAHIVQQK